MTINLSVPLANPTPELRPRISVIGVGGAGGNAVNNMIRAKLEGVEFIAANTDNQALTQSCADRQIQLGTTVTQGLGAGSRPDIGRIAAEEALEQIIDEIRGSNMVFIAAGMGGGTGTGAAPVIARAAREQGILTVGVVTKPFHFEGAHRMRIAEQGIEELEQFVDTLIVIPNQNLFRIANDRTTFADAFKMADDVLYSGVRGVTDLMVMPGLINLDFADIRAVMSEMGKAMMGTGQAEGDRRALDAAEAAISNPLLDDMSMKGARGVLINITGGPDITLFEVDEAANRIRSEVDPDAFIIFGSTFDETMTGKIRVSVVATGMETAAALKASPPNLTVVGRTADAKAAQRIARRREIGEVAAYEVGASALFAEGEGTAETAANGVAVAYRSGEHAAAAQETSGEDTGDAAVPPGAFIPPAPVSRATVAAAQRSADPVAAQAMAASGRADELQGNGTLGKMSNLFHKMTGGALGRTGRADQQPDDYQERPVAAARPQARFPAVNPDDRLPVSRPEEDLLDIPAFLRRQAN
jgi:cell division protein FtsZ